MVYKNKYDWIVKYIKDKKVLDLGCIQHNIDKTKKSNWLHGKIVKDAGSVLGVDYLKDEVIALNKCGYNIIWADVETMKLENKYEVIVAGDIIEHLSNFGYFLERVKEHLDSKGIFLLTTPNPVNLFRFLRQLYKGYCVAHPEHTCWFTEQVIKQLMEKHGFEIIDIGYVDDSYQYNKNKRWWFFYPLNYILCRIRSAFCETICVSMKLSQK